VGEALARMGDDLRGSQRWSTRNRRGGLALEHAQPRIERVAEAVAQEVQA
jgi:hypothetical protein